VQVQAADRDRPVAGHGYRPVMHRKLWIACA
jgi:hypothetical protein